MFADNLQRLRKERKITQTDFATLLNVSRGAVGNWETGQRIPDTDTLSRIADFFHVTVDYLLGRTDDPEGMDTADLTDLFPIKKRKFPILGKVACGEPMYADEEHEAYIMASADIDADFCLVARGDSMIGAHIEDGDIIFIKKMSIVPNGYIAVVLIEDETTLKYIDWRPESGTLILTPANPAYRTQVYTGEELNHIRIIGMAVVLHKSLLRGRNL